MTSTNSSLHTHKKHGNHNNGSNAGTLGACNFCRKMHSSCEGRPRCNNCVIRGIDCVFLEKKKPGPPLGYKKRKNSGSNNNANSTKEQEKRLRRSETSKATSVTTTTSPERTNTSTAVVVSTSKSTLGSQTTTTSNTTPTITLRKNPTPMITAPSFVQPQPQPQPHTHQPIMATSYALEYFPKESSLLNFSYGRSNSYFPDLSLSTTSPSSPFSMYYQLNNSTDCLCPETSLLVSSPLSYCSTPLNTIPGSPVATSSNPTTPGPSTPSSPAQDSKDASPTVEITIPSSTPFRINPDRFLAVASPYAQYLEIFQRMYKDDVLGIFPFIDIPSLEHLFPLAGMSREGKLSQILLFTQLGLGALGTPFLLLFHKVY
jgi:hypothetical protein